MVGEDGWLCGIEGDQKVGRGNCCCSCLLGGLGSASW